jgi:hypothetical protein
VTDNEQNPQAQSTELDKFLAGLSSGQKVDSGSFKLDTDKMLSKLRQAVTEPAAWIIKLLQASTLSDARFFIIRAGRKNLTVRVIARLHPEVTSSEEFFASAHRSRTHHHLLLCAIWLGSTQALKMARLRWSTSRSIEAVDICPADFTCHRIDLDEPPPCPFLEVEIERGPVSLLDKLFFRASYTDELVKLERASYLAPATLIMDSRVLHQGPFHLAASSRGFYEAPGSSGLKPFVYPHRLLPVWDRERRKQLRLLHSMKDRKLEATAYGEHVASESKSKLYWTVDGAIIQAEPARSEPREGGNHLFLSAAHLGTDLSTLTLIEGPEIEARRRDQAFWEWCFTEL